MDKAELDANYWDSRYKDQKTGWDLGQASPPLMAYIDQLDDKSIDILIPGAGYAHDAWTIFSNGFHNTYVCDWSREALDHFHEKYPTFPESQLICSDFFKINQSFDLVLEQTFFCALEPVERPKYAKKMASIIRDGGKLVGIFFNIEFEKEGPPFGGNISEYISIFQDHFKIKSFEDCYNSVGPRLHTEAFAILIK